MDTQGMKVAKVLLQDQVVLLPHSLVGVIARVDTPTMDCSCVLDLVIPTALLQQMQ